MIRFSRFSPLHRLNLPAGSSVGCVLAMVFLASMAGCEKTNVVQVSAVSVAVLPDEAMMLVGEEVMLEAVPRALGGERLTGRAVTWTSDDPLKATVTSTGLVVALAEGPVTISATVEGVQGSSAVTIEAGPEIILSPFFVLFQSQLGEESPEPVPVSITNGGQGRVEGLQRLIRYGQGGAGNWLAQTQLIGDRSPATLMVRANPGSLPEGEYTAEIEIRSTTAVNSPQILSVTLAVGQATPSIQLSATSVSVPVPRLFPNPVALPSIAIANGGGGELGNLNLEVEYDGGGQGWLSATLDAITAPTSLRLSATAGTLQVGVYEAVVHVRSPDADQDREVFVTLTIT